MCPATQTSSRRCRQVSGGVTDWRTVPAGAAVELEGRRGDGRTGRTAASHHLHLGHSAAALQEQQQLAHSSGSSQLTAAAAAAVRSQQQQQQSAHSQQQQQSAHSSSSSSSSPLTAAAAAAAVRSQQQQQQQSAQQQPCRRPAGWRCTAARPPCSGSWSRSRPARSWPSCSPSGSPPEAGGR